MYVTPSPILRWTFLMLFVRPLVLLVLGLNVRHRERLMTPGPKIIAVNHNSHLDTLVLLALIPLRDLPRVRPVAARDYFLQGKLRAWFALRVLGVIPIDRQGSGGRDPLAPISEALDGGAIVLIFPEGTRGQPERLDRLRTGVAHLAKRHPDVPVIPVALHGAGKAMPKGEGLLVPFIIDVFVGEPIPWAGDRHDFLERLRCQMATMLEQAGAMRPWA